MIDAKALIQRCHGRWIGIFHAMGMNVRDDGKHEGCPVCGNGRNSHRFRIDKDGSGRWICTQCGSGSGVTLVMRYLGCNFSEALEKIQSIVRGCEKVENQKPKTDPKIALNKLWQASTPLTGSDPASKYLHSRGLNLTPNDVRFCEKCYESDSKKEIPAMIARVCSQDGRPISLHRTYLNENKKADIESPKKLMPGTEPLNGGAIRLFLPGGMFKSGVLGLAEGIETAMSCSQLFQIATWAAISTSIMEAWLPPDNIKQIVIFGDNDSNFAGQKSAYILANKLYLRDLIVDVRLPAGIGEDFNDTLRTTTTRP